MKGLIEQSMTFFHNSFNEVAHLDSFQAILEYFKKLFFSKKSVEIVSKFYEEIKSEFFNQVEEALLGLLHKHKSLVLICCEHYMQYKCKEEDEITYNFLEAERKIEDTILEFLLLEEEEKDSQKHYNAFEQETYTLHESKEFDFFSIVENQETQDKTIIPDSLVSFQKPHNVKIYFENDSYKQIKYLIIGNQVSQIFKDDPNLNMHYLERKLVAKKKKNQRFRTTNSFLKTFSPKFMKKENLDKKILRRFKKYVGLVLKNELISERVGGSNNPVNRKISKSTAGLSCSKSTNSKSTLEYTIDNDSLKSSIRQRNLMFAYEFATKNYLPPFKANKLAFKSFNTKYMLWLFSDPAIFRYYKDFGEEYSTKLSDLIINEYDLLNKEAILCKQLPYYIRNMANFYSLGVEKDLTNVQISFAENNDALEKLNEINSTLDTGRKNCSQNSEISDSHIDMLEKKSDTFNGSTSFKRTFKDYMCQPYFKEESEMSYFNQGNQVSCYFPGLVSNDLDGDYYENVCLKTDFF